METTCPFDDNEAILGSTSSVALPNCTASHFAKCSKCCRTIEYPINSLVAGLSFYICWLLDLTSPQPPFARPA